MFQQNRISSILVMLTILFVVGIRSLKADDNLPRIILPTAALENKEITGTSYISEKQPYFTVYVWSRNEDHSDTYWAEPPRLYVDGHYIELSFLHGNHAFNDDSDCHQYVCFDADSVYFTVRTRKGFIAKSDETMDFWLEYSNLKNYSNCDQDWYIPVDIYMNRNISTKDAHRISLSGTMQKDDGQDTITARSYDDKYNYVETSATVSPTKLVITSTDLEWTAPGKLTFTSAELNVPNGGWGNYTINLEDVYSGTIAGGTAGSVTKDYSSNPNYKEQGAYKVGYNYCGVYNPEDPTRKYTDKGTLDIPFYFYPNGSCYHTYNSGYANAAFMYDRSLNIVSISGIRCFWDNSLPVNITVKGLDRKITKLELMDMYGRVVKTEDFSEPQAIATISTPGKSEYLYCIHVTFDRSTDGIAIDFLDQGDKGATTLTYPEDLKVTGDAWNKKLKLTWTSANPKSDEGTFYYVYRKDIAANKDSLLKTLSASDGFANFSYEDEDIDYEKQYNYNVYFVPKGWTDTPRQDSLGVSYNNACLYHTIQLSVFSAKALSEGYQLNWSVSTKMDKSGYKFKIYRKAVTADNSNLNYTDFTAEDKIAEVEVTNPNTLDYSYLDKSFDSDKTYSYMVAIEDIQETSLHTSPLIPDGKPGSSYVTSLKASHGTSTDKIQLEWTSNIVGTDYLEYDIYRHRIVEGEDTVTSAASAEQLSWTKITSSPLKSPTASFVDNADHGAEPGFYYAYAIVARTNGSNEKFSRQATYGFMRSTGTVYGSITYQNGAYAAEGVKVTLESSATTSDQVFNSMMFNGGEGGLHWALEESRKAYFKGDFSVQMYVRPEGDNNEGTCLLDMGGKLLMTLDKYDADSGYKLKFSDGTTSVTSTRSIMPDRFTHLTYAYKNDGTGVLYIVAGDTVVSENIALPLSMSSMGNQVTVASDSELSKTLTGYVDEVRFFDIQLTERDVKQNFNRILGGEEEGLKVYWNFDEGISTIRSAFDYSKTNSVYNENEALVFGGRRTNAITPTQDQLSLFGMTDTKGAYTISGIPYMGKGTTYSIIPTKGVHAFNPTTRTVYVSPTTLTFDPQDFEDKSSFNVKGVVYYENTTYPVKDCYFRLDGETTLKDGNGKIIKTDEKGEYIISVPIGDHFIQVVKTDHTFLNDGRYPATGTKNINDSISHLTFTDITKAKVVGRVVGGAVEKVKPLGFGQSKANIGAATLTLLTASSVEDAKRMNVYIDSIQGSFDSNLDRLYYKQASDSIKNCQAYVGGKSEGEDKVKYITIKTDPESGEFAFYMPPVPYYISTVVDNNTEASASFSSKVLLDCSNVSDSTYSAIVVGNDSVKYYYNTALVQTYISSPVITVEQTDNTDGAFGEYEVPAGELGDTVKAYTVTPDSIKYNYGYPLFKNGYKYDFKVSSFERYMNYDPGVAENEREQRVPTSGYLTFMNPWTINNDTVQVEKALLDSVGTYTYSFIPIYPNEVAPYTNNLNISLTIGNNVYSWEWENGSYTGPFECIVLGPVATGNTSVTKAPDRLINILRDPFGSNSSQTWHSGSTTTYAGHVSVGAKICFNNELENQTSASIKAATGAPGAYIYKHFAAGAKRTVGMDIKGGPDFHGGVDFTFTTTEDFKTSSDPYFDGPKGDVFIGVSTSLIYGDGLEVMLVNNQNGSYAVGTKEVICTGDSIETEFAYTQDHVINQLIPSFKRMREARLVQVSEADLLDKRANFVNNTDSIIYMTSLSPDDPRFGTCNDDTLAWGNEALDYWDLKWRSDSLCSYGPSYTAFLPASAKYRNDEEMWDAIVTINSNIKLWEDYLKENEKLKIDAYSNDPEKFYSFDSGSSITYSSGTSLGNTEGVKLSYNFDKYRKWAFDANTDDKKEMKGTFTFKFESAGEIGVDRTHKNSNTYTVNLSDPVADNFHEVRIYKDSEDYSLITRQMDGQTSRNYEDEERTQYYDPGRRIISNATVQIETPHIDCDQPVLTGVPTGEPAVFKLKLTNPTLASLSRRIDFKLRVDYDKWGQMSEVSINGAPDAHNYDITLAPRDSAMVTLKVKPASNDIIHIDSLHVMFYSAGQISMSDDIWLSAHFQPQAEPVTLTASKTLINTATDSTLVLTASGYDRNSSILNAVRMQQRKVGAPDWTTIHSWVKGTPAGSTESPLIENSIDTLINMRNAIVYPDAEYEFRAVTDCTVGTETVLGESETIKVIKDVTLPSPIHLPQPSDGVLGEGDEISVEFNEDIYSQSLTEVDNFVIQSVLNTDSVAHDIALLLSGSNVAAASTQSKLTLGGTSFTVCGWVKRDNTAGTFYQHGDDNNALCLKIDADGYLLFEMRDSVGVLKTYKSKDTLPEDTWTYLAFVYDYQAESVSAYAAYGENEKNLIVDEKVGKKISAEGNIYIGKGLKGAMHELSLYSAALTWTTIKAQMYLGKGNTTPALIGYWRLDEGHGNTSEDRARSRHMRLASSSSWYMENENISLALDNTKYASIPMGNLSMNNLDSYLVEMWALVDKDSKSGKLISLDDGKVLDIVLDNGNLNLVADSITYPTNTAVNDSQWHHVALNVMKGSGGKAASLLVDGVAVISNLESSKVPALAGAQLHLGMDMKGAIDEVRLWKSTNTQDAIVNRMYYRLDGSKTDGLVGYWPMEKSYYDEYDQRIYTFALENMGMDATASTTLVSSDGTALSAGTSAPGLKVAPNKTNLDFSFVANERTVSITLDHNPETLEGCTVFTTLRDYYDLHTNVGRPITWSFVVKQNPLSWNTAQIDLDVQADSDYTFTATLFNNGPSDQTWSFTQLPSWLEASETGGTIFAHGSSEITFTVKEGNAIGKYFATISARGQKGINTPLDICLNVEGKKPNWTPKKYSESMTAIGQIKIDNVISTDPNDMVGAFNELGECVGVGQPAYYPTMDAYYVFLYIYGSNDMKDKELQFRIYDASTGTTYPLSNVSETITFVPDGFVGNIMNPVIWENNEKVMQVMPLNEEYNWVSLNISPNDDILSQLFKPVNSQLNSLLLDGQTCYDKNGGWSNDCSVKPGQMMKVDMSQAADLNIVGASIDPAKYPITINHGSNWVGVPSTKYMTVDEAFAGLNPGEFDIVKNQTSFSQFVNGRWFGNLTVVEPGKGYIYFSQSDETKTFTFPSDVVEEVDTENLKTSGIAANFRYPHNMAVTCTVHNSDGRAIAASSVEAYDNMGELRGQSVRCLNDSIFLLVISGTTDGEPLILKANVRELSDSNQPVNILSFRIDHRLGNYRKPYVLTAAAPTNISETEFDADSRLAIYTVTGMPVFKGQASAFDSDKLSLGEVYIICETKSDGSTTTRKAVK